MVAPSPVLARLVVPVLVAADRLGGRGIRLRPRLFGFGFGGVRLWLLLAVLVVALVVSIIQRRNR